MNPAARLSVVIPAYRAEGTIEATLRSLQDQTSGDWEAVVVDDGSTDRTAAVVEGLAAADERIRLVRRPNGGVGAARNTGLEVASHPWVVFLDSDDMLSPRFVERALDVLVAHPRADGVNSAWVRMLPDGRLYDENPPVAHADLFDVAAQYCPFSIHSCVVRRDLVLEVGAFDEGLRICEDWDLWARMARAGARILPITGAEAIYRSRPDSASFDGHRMFSDGLLVLGRTHAPDARVRHPQRRAAAGRNPALLPETALNLSAWCAGLVIGSGGDPSTLFDGQRVEPVPTLSPESIAAILARADQIGALGVPLWQRWSDVSDSTSGYLEALEQRSGAPGLAARAEVHLARLAADECRAPHDVALGSLWSVPVELSDPTELRDAASRPRPDGVERLRLRGQLGGSAVGHAELAAASPVDALEPQTDRLIDAVVNQIWQELLEADAPSRPARRAGSFRLRRVRRPASWVDVLSDTVRGVRRTRVVGAAAEVHVECADGVPGLRWNADRVTVKVTLGGLAVANLVIVDTGKHISGPSLAATIIRHVGAELGRVAVRVGIIGRPDRSRTLRERLVDAASARRGPIVGEPVERPVRYLRVRPVPARWLLTRRLLPNVEGRLWATARALPPGRKRRAKRVARALGGIRHLLAPLRARHAVAVPILMFHRVGDEGAAATQRWRVTPRQFAAHLQALERAGYSCVSLDDLRRGMYEGAELPDRPVVLSFDDGYHDFAEHALPLLTAHDARATVFVVSDQVGASNAWDDVFADPAPLMDWSTLETLEAAGIEIGSHSATHAALTSLSPEDMRDQLVRSADRIEEKLGTRPVTLAYPYGDVDPIVAELAGRVGYAMAVTCDAGAVGSGIDPLLLPRLEVDGEMTPRQLLSRLRAAGA